MIHGVGEGTHSLFIDSDEHSKLIDYLEKKRNEIWTAPVLWVANHLKSFDPMFPPPSS
jgi:hypothetical protein